MKKLFPLFTVLVLLLALVQAVSGQTTSRVDLAVIRHITQPFLEALADKNIAVSTTFQCGTHYRKDWGNGTYMRLTGKGFVWTSASGKADLDLFTMPPPMSLEGFRPPMTLNTAPMDMDGNIVVGDPQYWIRYRIWQTRPCVRFSALLRENLGVAGAWNYWIAGRTDMHKYRDQWRELGLADDGRAIAYADLPLPTSELDTLQVDWFNAPYYLSPVETVQQEDIGEGNVLWKDNDLSVSSIVGLGVTCVILLLLCVGFIIRSGKPVKENIY